MLSNNKKIIMIKSLWLNLPVKDINKSKTFFEAIGFGFNNQYPENENSVCLMLGDKGTIIMLFTESQFKSFTGTAITDAKNSNEVLLSIDVKSKEAVDKLVEKVIEAGGGSDHKPTEMNGWMYGCVFSDLDGHKWNILFMDYSKMQQV